MKTITPSNKLTLIESAIKLFEHGLITREKYDSIVKQIYNSINIGNES